MTRRMGFCSWAWRREQQPLHPRVVTSEAQISIWASFPWDSAFRLEAQHGVVRHAGFDRPYHVCLLSHRASVWLTLLFFQEKKKTFFSLFGISILGMLELLDWCSKILSFSLLLSTSLSFCSTCWEVFFQFYLPHILLSFFSCHVSILRTPFVLSEYYF